MDLTLREGIHLQEAIHTAKEIDQKSKLSGFNQHALDQAALQGYGNAKFEVDEEEGVEIADEFYAESSLQQGQKQVHDFKQVQDVQKGLQQSVSTVS